MSTVPPAGGPGPHHDWTPVAGSPGAPLPTTGPGDASHGGPAPQHAAGPGVPAAAPRRDIGADLSLSLRWMWDAFSRNLAAFLVPGIVYGLVLLVGMGVMVASMVAGMAHDISTMDPNGMVTNTKGMMLGYGVALVLSPLLALPMIVWQTGAVRAASIVSQGRRPSVGEGFAGPWRVLLTALLVVVLTWVGMALLYLPGIAVAVATMYALPAAMRGAGPIQAIAESAQLVWKNLGVSLLALLLGGALFGFAGMFVVTVVAIVPLSFLFFWALYELLSGRALTEPARA